MTGLDHSSPEFSVIIPTYNRRELVLQAIDSAVSQIPPPLEVIVVDDGSTDGTEEVIEQRFPGEPVRVLRTRHAGASAARNEGVRSAKAEYISFLDSDDLYEPGKLRRYAQSIQKHPEGVLFHSYWIEHDTASGQRRLMTPVVEGDARHQLLMFSQIATPTVALRKREFLEVGGFRENLFLVEDFDLWCRMATLGETVLLKEPLSTVRLHSGNSYRNPHRIMINQMRMIVHFFFRYRTEGLQPRQDYIANSLYTVSFLYLREWRIGKAIGLFCRAWRYDWKNNRKRSLLMIGRSLKAIFLEMARYVSRRLPRRRTTIEATL